MRDTGDEAARKRRIILDMAVDGARMDLDLPLERGQDEPADYEDVDLAYLRSVAPDLLSIAARWAPEDGRPHVVDVLAVHYRSHRARQRVTWHVSYLDGGVPYTVVTDADTPAGAFFAVFWHHAAVKAHPRVAGPEAFGAALAGLTPILAQPLPNFAREIAEGFRDVMGMMAQVAAGAGDMTGGAPALPVPDGLRNPRPMIRAVGGRAS